MAGYLLNSNSWGEIISDNRRLIRAMLLVETVQRARTKPSTFGEYVRRPHQHFRRQVINDSPFLGPSQGRVEVVPHSDREQEFGFRFRFVDGPEIGNCDLRVVEGRLVHWPEQDDLFFIRSQFFALQERYRRAQWPQERLAVAFRHFIYHHYLAPAYPGWIMTDVTPEPAMVKVNHRAHGIDHLVESSREVWQCHMFLLPSP